MGDARTSPYRRRMLGEVAAFCALAFLLSWLLWLPALLSDGLVVRGQGWPTHFPGLVGPALAALLLVWWAGPAARADLRARFRWPSARGWALMLAPGAVVLGLVLAGVGAGWEGLTRHTGLPVLINGLGEEIGWRGWFLPRLQWLMGPAWGSMALGPIWALWHLLLFFAQESYLALPWAGLVFGFGLGMVAASLVLAHVAARAGILGAAVWHALYNMGVATDLGGPASQIMAGLALVWALLLVLTPAGRRALRVPAPSPAS